MTLDYALSNKSSEIEWSKLGQLAELTPGFAKNNGALNMKVVIARGSVVREDA